MTPLEAEIRQIITSEGPMPVARYMALCLGHPTKGYYASREPFGARGDFVTAPEISQMFGELIGMWAAAVWQRMGAPACVNLVELGPGRGTLMADALRASKVTPDFRAAIAVHLVETSARLRDVQRATLARSGVPLAWHADLGETPRGRAIVLANEFFDAMPIHQAVKVGDGWRERVVGLDAADRLTFGVGPEPLRRPPPHPSPTRGEGGASGPASSLSFRTVGEEGGSLASGHPPPCGEGSGVGRDALMPPQVRHAAVGSIYEWRSAEILGGLCDLMRDGGGAALIIDYGHTESGVGDTLQAVRGHTFVDPLAAPGEADLTAHVDFAALARIAAQRGVRVNGPLTQGEFLRRLGIDVRAARLKANATREQAATIDGAVARLTDAASSQMGELFKVLAVAAPSLGPLPAFTP